MEHKKVGEVGWGLISLWLIILALFAPFAWVMHLHYEPPERVFVCPDPAYNSDANYTDDDCPVEMYQAACEWRIMK